MEAEAPSPALAELALVPVPAVDAAAGDLPVPEEGANVPDIAVEEVRHTCYGLPP